MDGEIWSPRCGWGTWLGLLNTPRTIALLLQFRGGVEALPRITDFREPRPHPRTNDDLCGLAQISDPGHAPRAGANRWLSPERQPLATSPGGDWSLRCSRCHCSASLYRSAGTECRGPTKLYCPRGAQVGKAALQAVQTWLSLLKGICPQRHAPLTARIRQTGWYRVICSRAGCFWEGAWLDQYAQ